MILKIFSSILHKFLNETKFITLRQQKIVIINLIYIGTYNLLIDCNE